MQQLRAALTRNAKQLSPITISWAMGDFSSSPPAQAIRDLRLTVARPEDFFFKSHFRLSWQDGQVHVFQSGANNRWPGEWAFDGTILYYGALDTLQLFKHRISNLAKTDPDSGCIEQSYLEEAGLRIPALNKELGKKKDAESVLLVLLDGGGKLRSIAVVDSAGHTLVRVAVVAPDPDHVGAVKMNPAKYEAHLRNGANSEELIQTELRALRAMREGPKERIFEFDFDPSRGYAVVRRQERYDEGRVIVRVTNDDFQRVKGRDVWLPYTSKIEFFTWPSIFGEFLKTPLFLRNYQVSKVDTSPISDDRFSLNYTQPGAEVFGDVDDIPAVKKDKPEPPSQPTAPDAQF